MGGVLVRVDEAVPNVHRVAHAFGMVLVGISVSLIFVSLVAYPVDVYL